MQVEGPDDTEEIDIDAAEENPRKRKTIPKEKKGVYNADKIKQKRKFQQTPPDQLITREIRTVFDNEIFDETYGAEDEDGVSDKKITEMWAEHMHDFVPEDMVNFIIPDKQHTVLFETIRHDTPTTIKGAYFVKGGTASKYVSVMVLDPKRNVVYMKKQAPQHIILFDTTQPGEYSFIFGNLYGSQEITVTMALHTYELQREEPIEYDLDDEGNRIIRGAKPVVKDAEEELAIQS